MSWIRENTLNWFQYFATKVIKSGYIPKHIAFIMDGNRRYANKNKVNKVQGHTKGFDKLAETLHWCMDLGILEVTVYAFSIENFKRSKEEVDGLMDLAKEKFQKLLDEKNALMEHGIRVRVVGNLSLIPESIRKLIVEAMFITRNNNRASLNVAFAYTCLVNWTVLHSEFVARDEITHAVKDIVQGIDNSEVLPDDVNEELISQCLYTYQSPNPDLLIRTSGEVRFSDFLMWQNSNTCIYFADVLWPEFNIWNLLTAVFHYQRSYSNLKKLADTKCFIQHTRAKNYVSKLHKQRQTILKELYFQLNDYCIKPTIK